MENIEMICARCGYVGQKERFSKGSYLLEMLLWLMLFVPGAIYTTWRFFNEYHACPICGNQELTPVKSSFGKKILAEKNRSKEKLSPEEQLEVMKKIIHFWS